MNVLRQIVRVGSQALAAVATCCCSSVAYAQGCTRLLLVTAPLVLAAQSMRLAWPVDGIQPVETIDLGAQTEGGYAVFNVTGFSPAGKTREGKPTGLPVLRISYATHPDGLGPEGDFTRKDCAHYLGMDFDNPVLPANVNRFETYTIAGEEGSGIICLNGAAAKCVSVGDKVIIMAYANMTPQEAASHKPTVLFVDDDNNIVRKANYEKHGKLNEQ